MPVEKVAGRVLLLSGGDDQLWPAAHTADAILARAEPSEHVAHEMFADAGHVILLPNQPTWGTTEFGGLAMGGGEEANAVAARESWPRILEFLGDALR